MTVITVSRQMGAGAERIIAEVSSRLELTVIDRSVISRAAQAAGVPQVAFQELTYEGQPGLVRRMLHLMDAAPSHGAGESGEGEPLSPLSLPFGGAFTSSSAARAGGRLSLEHYARLVAGVIQDLARQDHILIVGMGAAAVLREDTKALHVQIIADFEDRVRRLMERDSVARGEALRRLRASDDARADFVRRYQGLDWLDAQNYHLTLNTSRLSLERSVAAILAAAQPYLPAPASES